MYVTFSNEQFHSKEFMLIRMKCDCVNIQANPEIGLVWAVGQKMWQRDFSGVYEALSKEWNNGLQPIMEAVQGIYIELLYFVLQS